MEINCYILDSDDNIKTTVKDYFAKFFMTQKENIHVERPKTFWKLADWRQICQHMKDFHAEYLFISYRYLWDLGLFTQVGDEKAFKKKAGRYIFRLFFLFSKMSPI